MEHARAALHHHLETHGHGFQYRVLHETERLFKQSIGRSWSFEVQEHPVRGTHVDFVLWHECDHVSYYLVVECKRTNPAYSKWAFLRTPYVRHGESGYEFLAEGLRKNEKLALADRIPVGVWCEDRPSYNHAAELKSQTHGDSCTEGKGALQRAIEQALRGVFGLAGQLRHRQSHLTTPQAVFLPAVITTADLLVGDLDVGAIDLATGAVDQSKLALERQPFLLHSHGASPDIQGDVAPVPTRLHGLPQLFDAEFHRTLLIIQASELERFFRWFAPIARPLQGI